MNGGALPAALHAGHAGPPVAGLLLAVVVLAVTALVVARRRPSPDEYRRGVRLQDAGRRRRHGNARGGESGRLTLAGVPVAPRDETKHFKLIGTTGTGKSTAIQELLGAALRRGDRAVFADPDGGYLTRFFNRYRGDLVLNPFARHSARWDLFGEIDRSHDVEQLAAGLIASSPDVSANEWRLYARVFLAALIRHCRTAGEDAGELWRLLSQAAAAELRDVVQNTPAQPFLEPDNARMLGSIRSVAVSAMAAFEHVHSQRASPLSIRAWVRSGTGSLFMPYQAGQIAALRAMIATWLRIAFFEAMNGTQDCDQRLWFVIDELDALGTIEGLKDALARLRKFGGRCVLGFQSIGQVSAIYGPGDAQTIVENCGNTLILRCSASENGGTAQFASRLIGEREVVRRQTSRGRDRTGALSAQGARRSKNVSEQQVTEAAVMPSELEQLADLRGYFKAASSPAWLRVSLRARARAAGPFS